MLFTSRKESADSTLWDVGTTGREYCEAIYVRFCLLFQVYCITVHIVQVVQLLRLSAIFAMPLWAMLYMVDLTR